MIGLMKYWRLAAGLVFVVSALLALKMWTQAFYTEGYRDGAAEQRESEKLCVAGSVCEESTEHRAAEQAALVNDLVRRAMEDELARVQRLQREYDQARNELAASAEQARQRAAAAESRYRLALRESRECKTWDELVVPCPLD